MARCATGWKGPSKGGPFFAEITPKGRQGWLVQFAPRWLDWRILQHNYPDRRDFQRSKPVSAEISADTKPPISAMKTRIPLKR